MKASAFFKALILAACIALASFGFAFAASFSEVTGGVRDITGAAKDISTINQNQQQQQPAQVQQQPQQQQKPAKKSAPQQSKRESAPRYQGG